jgi:hypothetical protein
MMAIEIVAKTADRLACMPLFVTDGLKFYARSLLEQFGQWINYPATGKRGRPRKDRLAPVENLKYARIIKIKQGGRPKSNCQKDCIRKRY